MQLTVRGLLLQCFVSFGFEDSTASAANLCIPLIKAINRRSSRKFPKRKREQWNKFTFCLARDGEQLAYIGVILHVRCSSLGVFHGVAYVGLDYCASLLLHNCSPSELNRETRERESKSTHYYPTSLAPIRSGAQPSNRDAVITR